MIFIKNFHVKSYLNQNINTILSLIMLSFIGFIDYRIYYIILVSLNILIGFVLISSIIYNIVPKKNNLSRILLYLYTILNTIQLINTIYKYNYLKLNFLLVNIFIIQNIGILVLSYIMKSNIEYPYRKLKENIEVLQNQSDMLDKINSLINKHNIMEKKIETNLQYRENLLNSIFDLSPNGCIITDEKLNIKYENKFIKSKFEYKIENLVDLKEIILNKNELINKLNNLKNTQNIVGFDIFLNEKVYCMNVLKIDNLNEYMCIFVDVTNEKYMEENLLNINTTYEKIINNIPIPVSVRTYGNDKNRIISINKSYEENLKYTYDEIVGMDLIEYIDKIVDKETFENINDWSKLNYTYKNKIIEDEVIDLYKIKDKSGDIKYIELNSTTYKADDDMEYRVVSYKDITEIYKTIQKLEVLERKYKALIDKLPEAIIVENIDIGKVVYTNDKFRQLFNIKDDLNELQLQKNLFVNEYIEKIIKKINRDKMKRVNDLKIEIDGKVLNIDIISIPFNFNGRFSKLRIIRDLNEIKKAKELKMKLKQQIQQFNMKIEFFSNISHELKTPLNNMFSSIQLIEMLYKRGKVQDKDNYINQHIKITKQNIYRLLRLVDNIIDISQVESEFYKINPVNFDIVNLTEEITDSVRYYALSKNIAVVFDTNIEEKIINLDPDALERILLNILSNAVKFTDEGGNIYVNLLVDEGNSELKIEVIDTGIGIPKEKLAHIFDRFEQVDKSLFKNKDGSGIGLSLVKSLVEVQGGTIEIESKWQEGTKMTISFPIKNIDIINEKEIHKYDSNVEKVEIEFFDIYA